MEWLKGLNRAVWYIEENLSGPISQLALAQAAGCSVSEFSRIFSFMAGMPVSEYIRLRRLSQAVFDIQNSSEKIIDIALKYGYSSPAAFTRAFKELHGVAPSDARRAGIPLKTYLPIAFVLTVKGVNAMNFRIEKRESFQIVGLAGYDQPTPENGDKLTPLWRKFMDGYNPRLWNGGGERSLYTAPFWQVGAYWPSESGQAQTTAIGAEYKGQQPEGMTLTEVPAATWAVFPICSPTGIDYVPDACARVVDERLPTSQYQYDPSAPWLEVFPDGDASSSDYTWELWVPLLSSC